MNVNSMISSGVGINQTWNASIHLDHSSVSAFVGLLDVVKGGCVKVSKKRILFHMSSYQGTPHLSQHPDERHKNI